MALIGIDIGTTQVKAVMTDRAGLRLADYAAHYPTQRPRAGWVEQAPQDWWAHVLAILTRFEGLADRVEAIGITSQVNTHVFSDADLSPLRPAIVWQDGRAADVAAGLDAQLTPDAKVAALGAPIPIDASHALSRMAWVAAHEPQIWAQTAHVLAPKDWVIARLTGRVAGDPIASVGLVGTDLAYAGAVVGLLPRAGALLPPLLDPLAIVGQVAVGLPCAGMPVACGTMDAWAAMFGTGVAEEGQGFNLSGTSEVLGLISAQRNPVKGVITFPPWRGITLHAGPTQSGGAALAWIAQIIGRGVEQAAHLTEGLRPAPESPLFLPHLAGERAPLWDTMAKGCFAGLRASDGPAEMVLAVMEGVAFSARLALEALEAAGGCRPAVLRGGGGGTASDPWCQIRADTFGRPFERMAARDAGALGALVMGGVAAGLMPDLAAAARQLVPADRLFSPEPAAIAIADRRFALWRQLYDQIRPINAGLGAPSFSRQEPEARS